MFFGYEFNVDYLTLTHKLQDVDLLREIALRGEDFEPLTVPALAYQNDLQRLLLAIEVWIPAG